MTNRALVAQLGLNPSAVMALGQVINGYIDAAPLLRRRCAEILRCPQRELFRALDPDLHVWTPRVLGPPARKPYRWTRPSRRSAEPVPADDPTVARLRQSRVDQSLPPYVEDPEAVEVIVRALTSEDL
jgi:hypothetical protein